jgi:hypothetical protein
MSYPQFDEKLIHIQVKFLSGTGKVLGKNRYQNFTQYIYYIFKIYILLNFENLKKNVDNFLWITLF